MVSLPECAVQNGYDPVGRQDFWPYTIPTDITTDITLGYRANLTFPGNGYLHSVIKVGL